MRTLAFPMRQPRGENHQRTRDAPAPTHTCSPAFPQPLLPPTATPVCSVLGSDELLARRRPSTPPSPPPFPHTVFLNAFLVVVVGVVPDDCTVKLVLTSCTVLTVAVLWTHYGQKLRAIDLQRKLHRHRHPQSHPHLRPADHFLQ